MKQRYNEILFLADTCQAATLAATRAAQERADAINQELRDEIVRMRAELDASRHEAAEVEQVYDDRMLQAETEAGVEEQVYDDRMLEHHCPWDPHHIESPARLARIWTRQGHDVCLIFCVA